MFNNNKSDTVNKPRPKVVFKIQTMHCYESKVYTRT